MVEQSLGCGVQSVAKTATNTADSQTVLLPCRRMRALVTHRKLRDIANAQQSELEVLRAELQRLQRKTFPTFVNADASLLAYGPDDRIPASSTPHA